MLAARRLARGGVVLRRWCTTGSSSRVGSGSSGNGGAGASAAAAAGGSSSSSSSSSSSGGPVSDGPGGAGSGGEEKVEWYALWRTRRGRRYLCWLAAAYSVTLGLVLYAKAAVERSAEDLQRQQQQQQAAGNDRASKLSLGGHFKLTDQHGLPFDTASLAGRWWVVYFGFASCPTVCPAELRKITDTVAALETDFGPGCVTPVFVSLDPARDTPAALREFLAPFHPSFIGLTGTEAEVKDVASKFRVYYSVIDTDDQNLKPGESPEDYQIDHSCIIYLMNPSGKFCDFFSKETDGGVAIEKVARHLDGTMSFVDQ
ncbi:Protein SCO1 [Diplonema papillatum]|nr:Protein SCO1 [Diplonema papillatum]KAJ9457488.1 Protein SCO1 [Diplonema papillatum]KAJ9457489.1 Protein SCO1 [Diplonema papillatum]KAJ9457490.1 Protein SCO1 [Diplonema papillatum]